ncbi:MAG: HAMP domain-containing histidine kinase [Spirochaetales bacterium]|nr:HAMP domain-containing histidine kinase [Spirochaetales bacterium]
MVTNKRKIDPLIFIIIIIAILAIGLGFLQLKWINSFSKSSEVRLRSSLNNSMLQILNSTKIDTSILYSVIYLTDKEVEEKDYTRFERDLESWRTNTTFKELFKTAYLTVPSSNDEFQYYRWDRNKADFMPIPSPAFFEKVWKNFTDGSLQGLKELEKEIRREGIFLISPVMPAASENKNEASPPPLPTILTIEINTEYINNTILPYYINKYLQDYPFSITSTDSSETIISQGEMPEVKNPELSVPINKSLYIPFSDQFDHRNEEEQSLNFFIRLWMTINEIPNEATNNDHLDFNLNVFYPEEDLSSQIKKTRIFNLIVSTGFEGLFLATLIILYILYRRNRDMRIKERNFISSMSHELRTPIAVIKSTSDTLKKGIVTDQERIQLYSNTISKQANRLSDNVEGILKYSGLIENKNNLPITGSTNLSEIAADTSDAMELLIIEKNGILTKKITPGIEANINKEAFRLIVENLLSNALKHGLQSDKPERPQGEITVELSINGDFAELKISDRGPGISIFEKKRIFSPFFRCKYSRENQTPGNGLGLHLVKRTIEILGGSVEVQTPCYPEEINDRRGSRFIVQIPITKEEI